MDNTVSGTANIDGLELYYAAVQRKDGLWHITMTSPDGLTSRRATQVWPALHGMVNLAINHRNASLNDELIGAKP